MKYIVKFVPDNDWGCITEIANSKEDAYKIYHKTKADVDVRPGHLYILEVNEDGNEKYLCNYKTGRNKDGLAMIEETKKLVEYLINLYDMDYINKKINEYNKLSTDIIHGIELIDFTKVNEEEVMKRIFNQQKILTNTRRQYKYLIQEANEIQQYLKQLEWAVDGIEKVLNKYDKRRNNEKENTREKIKYLETIGVDINEYFKEN